MGAHDEDPRRERRRLLATFLAAILVPGVALSAGALHAARSDAFVLAKRREERLAAAARALVDEVEGAAREVARAALEPLAEEARRAGSPEGLTARLEAARARAGAVRELFLLDGGGALRAPATGDAAAPGTASEGDEAGADPLAEPGADSPLEAAIARHERQLALERRLADVRRRETLLRDPLGARDQALELAQGAAFAPDVAARARFVAARAAASGGDREGALAELDLLARLSPRVRTEGGLSIAPAARLRAAELRLEGGVAEAAAARALELAEDILAGRPALPLAEARVLLRRARRVIESALPSLAEGAPAFRDAALRLERAEARAISLRAFARDLVERLLPDLRAVVEGGALPERDVELVTLGGEAPRLFALRALLPPREGEAPWVVGAEVDLPAFVEEAVLPRLARIGEERGALLAVLDRRGRPVAEGALARPGAAPTDAEALVPFEAILPFWRVRAASLEGDAEAREVRLRLALQAGMVVVLLGVMGAGGLLTLRAIERSQELARLKSEFVSQVSHELRTPLTSIRMFAELLRGGRARTPEKTQDYLARIDAESERLQKLIDGILDFARREAGRGVPEMTPGDAGEIAEEAVAALGAQLVGAGFRVDLDVRRPLPPVRLEREGLRSAVENLLSNAIKYAGERKAVAVSVRPAPGGRAVLLEVRDEGRGIPPDELPRVFERFFRGRDAAASNVPGSGLGLALVQRVVLDHGGAVQVASRAGEGTTFTITLPAAG